MLLHPFTGRTPNNMRETYISSIYMDRLHIDRYS